MDPRGEPPGAPSSLEEELDQEIISRAGANIKNITLHHLMEAKRNKVSPPPQCRGGSLPEGCSTGLLGVQPPEHPISTPPPPPSGTKRAPNNARWAIMDDPFGSPLWIFFAPQRFIQEWWFTSMPHFSFLGVFFCSGGGSFPDRVFVESIKGWKRGWLNM